MIIAIDYDNTYTADPETFNKMIALFQAAGHTVICVTARPETMGASVMASIGQLVPVVFAGTEWKRQAAEKRGYKVDVWVDDSPEYIGKQTILSGGWAVD